MSTYLNFYELPSIFTVRTLPTKLVPPIADHSRGPEAYQRPLLRSISAAPPVRGVRSSSKIMEVNMLTSRLSDKCYKWRVIHKHKRIHYIWFVSVPDRPMGDSEKIFCIVWRGVKIEHPSIHGFSICHGKDISGPSTTILVFHMNLKTWSKQIIHKSGRIASRPRTFTGFFIISYIVIVANTYKERIRGGAIVGCESARLGELQGGGVCRLMSPIFSNSELLDIVEDELPWASNIFSTA